MIFLDIIIGFAAFIVFLIIVMGIGACLGIALNWLLDRIYGEPD